MSGPDYGGFFTDDPPKKKKRPRTRAREVEQPSVGHGADEANPPDYGGFFADKEKDAPAAAPDADLKHGAPPGPAGTTSRSPGPGRDRTSAWYEPLLESVGSYAQGAALNLGDEATAGAYAVGDALGLTHSGNSYEENADIYKRDADRITNRYPIAHGAGQATIGTLAGMAAPNGALTQGAVQALLGAGSEYADSRDWKKAGIQGGISGAAGTAGAWAGNQIAKRFAVVDPVKNAILRGPVSPDDMVKAPTPDILARGGAPRELVQTLEAQPRPLPNDVPTSYDPLAAQQMATPVGTPRPLPVPDGPTPPPDAVARLLRGSNGKFQKILPMELDTTPAPQLARMPEEGARYSGRWDVNLPPDAPLDFAPKPRVGSAPPIESTPSLPPIEARRVPTGPVEPIDIGAPSWDLASSAQRQAATPPGATLDHMLAVGSHIPGLSLPSRLGRAGLRMIGGPDAAAREAGVYLNDPARQLARGGFEAGWEMGAPALMGRKVNAQDGEQTAYATAPTLNYALSATLHQDQTGLSPQDEAALTRAVIAGDDKQIAAVDFRLRQKYPAYAQQVERELRSLNDEGEE